MILFRKLEDKRKLEGKSTEDLPKTLQKTNKRRKKVVTASPPHTDDNEVEKDANAVARTLKDDNFIDYLRVVASK